MTIFYTPTHYKLASTINKMFPKHKLGKFIIKQFKDGEWYVRILEDVNDKEVLLIANVNAPADNLVQLLLLHNALLNAGAFVKLFIPYLGYQKQDRIVEYGEAISLQVITSILNSLQTEKRYFVALHSNKAQELLQNNYLEIDPIESLAITLKKYNLSDIVIAAPDKGSKQRATKLAHLLGIKKITLASKKRTADKEGVKEMIFDTESLHGHNVILIDDFVQSGGTIVEAVNALRKIGAKSIHLTLLHGFLFAEGMKIVEDLKLDTILLTDTLPLPYKSDTVTSVSIAKQFTDALLAKS